MTQPNLVCQHLWKLPSPAGHTSKGTCSYCGEKRTFYNSVFNESDLYNSNFNVTRNFIIRQKDNSVDRILESSRSKRDWDYVDIT